MATPSERDAFYESFWVLPDLPTPQIKGGVLAVPLATNDAALTPAMADMRLIVRAYVQTRTQLCRYLSSALTIWLDAMSDCS